MDLTGNNLRRLTDDPAGDTLANWAPNSQQLVFVSNRNNTNDIYIIDLDGRNLHQITNTALYEGHPSWSVDDLLVFTAGDYLGYTWEIYTMNLDGSNRQQLTDNTVTDWSPEWSPDGQQILFIRAASRADPAAIHIMDKDGSNQRPFYNTADYDWGARWSPDGQFVAFTIRIGDDNRIYQVNAAGLNPVLLTEQGSYPSWVTVP